MDADDALAMDDATADAGQEVDPDVLADDAPGDHQADTDDETETGQLAAHGADEDVNDAVSDEADDDDAVIAAFMNAHRAETRVVPSETEMSNDSIAEAPALSGIAALLGDDADDIEDDRDLDETVEDIEDATFDAVQDTDDEAFEASLDAQAPDIEDTPLPTLSLGDFTSDAPDEDLAEAEPTAATDEEDDAAPVTDFAADLAALVAASNGPAPSAADDAEDDQATDAAAVDTEADTAVDTDAMAEADESADLPPLSLVDEAEATDAVDDNAIAADTFEMPEEDIAPAST
ncbi:MAG: hypothetical protein AAFU50_08870, partial [Pseudomonadota bacterium]